MTLTEFLLARLAEDEAVARAATEHQGAHWFDEGGIVSSDAEPVDPRGRYLDMYAPDGRWMLWDCEGASSLGVHETTSAHIARHDPARVLAECEAKRRIVEWHANWPVLVEKPVEFDPSYGADQTFPDQVAMRVSQQIAWLTQGEYRTRFGDEPPTAPVLALLALPYADHPDYRPEWAL